MSNVCFRRLIDVGRAVQWCHSGWKKGQKRAAKRRAGRGAHRPSTRRAGMRDTWSAWDTWTGGAAARAARAAWWADGCAPPLRAPVGPSSASSRACPSASSSSNTAPTSCRRIARPHTQHSTPASQRSYVSVSLYYFHSFAF